MVELPLRSSSTRHSNDRAQMVDRIHLFASKKLDPMSMGTVNLYTDAILGLPLHFNYRALQDIDLDLLQTPYSPHIDWDSFSGERFCNAIVLSDSAKAFAIAREVQMCRNHHVIGGTVLKSFCAFSTYFLWHYLDQGLVLQRRLKPIPRFVFFAAVAQFGYFMYVSMADLYQCWSEKGADRSAARLGWAYAQGGAEYYTKTLDRNKALRKLLENEGERLFTLHGNESSFLRRRHLQLTERKTTLEGYCKWYEQGGAPASKDSGDEESAV